MIPVSDLHNSRDHHRDQLAGDGHLSRAGRTRLESQARRHMRYGPQRQQNPGQTGPGGSGAERAVSEPDGEGLPFTPITTLKLWAEPDPDRAVKFGSGRAGNRNRVERIWAGWSRQKPLRRSPGLGPDPLPDPQSGFPGWAGGARSRKAVDGHAPPNSVGKPDARTARKREATCIGREAEPRGPCPMCPDADGFVMNRLEEGALGDPVLAGNLVLNPNGRRSPRLGLRR